MSYRYVSTVSDAFSVIVELHEEKIAELENKHAEAVESLEAKISGLESELEELKKESGD